MDTRLKRQQDFDIVFNKGKRAYSPSLTLVYLERKTGGVKIGISIGKKHGGAVTRNRIKRLLRAAYIPMIPLIKGSYYIVFLPKVSEEYSFLNFKNAIDFLLKKEKIIDEVSQ